MLPLVLNAIGAAIGKPLWPFDIGDVEAEKIEYHVKLHNEIVSPPRNIFF